MKAQAGVYAIGIAIIVLALVVAAGQLGWFPGQVTEEPEDQAPPEDITTCESDTTPTTTLNTPDLYGGSAVTTQNIIREVGKTSSTDVAGAGTFTSSVGDEYEILFGIDSNDDDAEPYGPKITYTTPCDETPDVEQQVVDDALATDLTALAFDPDDNNQITAADPVDLDAGDIKTIKFRWTGAFEEDFGNRWCEDDENVKNVIVVRYNTSSYDNVYVTDLAGNKVPTANVQISRLLSASSGFTDLTFEFPVLRSNADYEYKLVLDADDSNNPSGTNGNVTLYLYDVNWFIDNDFTPSQWKCGIMDEDGSEVGAAAADTLNVVITGD